MFLAEEAKRLLGDMQVEDLFSLGHVMLGSLRIQHCTPGSAFISLR